MDGFGRPTGTIFGTGMLPKLETLGLVGEKSGSANLEKTMAYARTEATCILEDCPMLSWPRPKVMPVMEGFLSTR